MQTKAFAGHLVSLDASLRERYQTPRKYIDGPSFVGASVRSRGQNWFNYRLGVRHWLEDTLPAFEMSDLRLVLRPPPRREATAGCSVEHQATLWRGARRAAPRGKGRRPGGYAALPQTPCVVVGGLVGATARVGKFDSDAYPKLAETLRVGGLPTIIAFRGGREATRVEGAVMAGDLVRMVS